MGELSALSTTDIGVHFPYSQGEALYVNKYHEKQVDIMYSSFITGADGSLSVACPLQLCV